MKNIIQNIKRKDVHIRDVHECRNNKGFLFPLFSFIDLNITELCNRTCIFCPRGHKYPNAPNHMDIGTAKILKKQLDSCSFSGIINICGNGEPLLHPKIKEIISSLYPHRIELVTNGDFLDEHKIRELYKVGVAHISVSLYDGPSQVQEFQNKFKNINIPEERYALRYRWFGEEKEYGLKLTNRAGVLDIFSLEGLGKGKCYYPHYSMQIDWNGDILHCIQAVFNKQYTYENILKQDILNIWLSKKMHNVRKNLLSGLRDNEPCKSCNADGTLHGMKHTEQWGKIYEKE